MNTPAAWSDDAFAEALRSYRSDDPISLRLLVDAVEGRARRMRAEALRDLSTRALRWVCRGASIVAATAEPLARREPVSS
jgi:hypothetical protein